MSAIEREPLNAIYVLQGDEPALHDTVIDALKRRLTDITGQTIGVVRYWFDDDGGDEAIRACQSVTLFGGQDVVVLENCLFFSSAKVKFDSARFEDYLSHPVEGRVLVITVPTDGFDERKKITKKAKTHALVDCRTPKADAAILILRELAQAKGIRIDTPSLAEVFRRTQRVTSTLRELEKLSLFVNGAPITPDVVEEVVAPPLEDNVFRFVEAIMEGNAARSFHDLSDLLLTGTDPLGLISLLSRQLRLMWFAKWGKDNGLSQGDIASKVGAHPYSVKVAGTQSRNASLTTLEDLLLLVADAEFAIKSGRRDPHQALDWVIMACLASKGARPRAI